MHGAYRVTGAWINVPIAMDADNLGHLKLERKQGRRGEECYVSQEDRIFIYPSPCLGHYHLNTISIP